MSTSQAGLRRARVNRRTTFLPGVGPSGCNFLSEVFLYQYQRNTRVASCARFSSSVSLDQKHSKSSGSIPGRNSEVWRVHLVYVASGIASSRHIRRRTDQPSYREPGPLGCNFLTRECFIAKKHSTIILRKMMALHQGGSNFSCGANYPHQALMGGCFVFVWRVGT